MEIGLSAFSVDNALVFMYGVIKIVRLVFLKAAAHTVVPLADFFNHFAVFGRDSALCRRAYV